LLATLLTCSLSGIVEPKCLQWWTQHECQGWCQRY
jgi:hypothetical protein